MRVYLLILLPIFIGLINYIVPSKKSYILSVLSQIFLFGLAINNFLLIKSSESPIIATIGGEGALGINLYIDRTAGVFVILVTFLFLILNIYTYDDYLKNKLFQFLYLSLEGLMVLIFISRDIFNLFIAIQIATIVCSILIMYKRDSRSIYDGLLYLMTNVVGILFFLFGAAMLYKTFGILDMKALSDAIGTVDKRAVIIPYALLMTGIGVKCAIFPVFSWLPKAHGSPGSPPVVSALLCGLYVKGAMYIYIRVREMFLPTVDMDNFFIILGIVTSLVGIILALCQKELKLILAYHTVSQLGLIFLAVSSSDKYTNTGGLIHIINHTLFKSLLFIASGVLMSKYKTKNIYKVRDVFRKYPFTGFAVLIGVLGITGAPFMNGSVSKYYIQAGMHGQNIEWFLLLINFGTTLSFVKFGTVLFPSKTLSIPEVTPESKTKSFSMVVLSLVCIYTGVRPSFLSEFLLGSDIKIDAGKYTSKGYMWVLFIGLSILVYKLVISKLKFFKKGADIELSFNNIALTIVSLFFIVLGAIYKLIL